MAHARAERTRSEHPCHALVTSCGMLSRLVVALASAVKIAAFACPSVSGPAGVMRAALELRNDDDSEGVGWLWDQGAARLDVELYPIDGRVLIAYGDVAAPAGPLRSMLLRSHDGGKSWREVMRPHGGSTILRVAFVDELHGWALWSWGVESPGMPQIARTADGGRRWRELGEVNIGADEHTCSPLSLRFTSTLAGEVEYHCDAGPTHRLARTRDGGRTWLLQTDDTASTLRVEASDDVATVPTLIGGSRWSFLQADRVQVLRRQLGHGPAWSDVGWLPRDLCIRGTRVAAPP